MTTAEKLIDTDLTELLGGVTPPDLIDRTLARIANGDQPQPQPTHEAAPVPASAPSPGGRVILFRRLATAACMILALGLITWVLWPKPLPDTVTASTAASYLVRDDHIELKNGWLLLEDGAPEVRSGVGRVGDVHGRAIAGVGIPDEAALDSLADQLGLSASEREMFKLRKRWLTAGGLALCLLTGNAMLNDTRIDAEDLPKPEVKQEKIEIPKADDIEGVRKLVRGAVSVEVMVDGKTLMLTDVLDVRRVTEALTAEGFATSDKHLTWDPWDAVTMFLADGQKITTSGLSWEKDVYEMTLPGMVGAQTYTTPGGAHDVLREYFDRAKKIDTPKPVNSYKTLREWKGADSEITEKRCEVVIDAEAWDALFLEHALPPHDEGTNPPKLPVVPDVDFANEMVVAVFGGKGTNSRGYVSVEVLEGESAITLRVDETTYQSMNGADSVTSYGFFVIARTELSVIVEENAQSLKNRTPLWKNIGGRTPETVPSPEILWQPSYTRAENGGPGGSDFRVIYNREQWNAAIEEVGVRDELWPMPDFGKNIAFFATGTKVKGLQGNLVLAPIGWNTSKTVVRLSSPVAQMEGDPQSEGMYGLWVFPRPNRDVVLETQVVSMTEPVRWQEAQTFRSGNEPFGVHDYRAGLSGGLNEAKYGLANDATEFAELIDGMSVRWQEDPNWVDWKRESVVVVFPGERRFKDGLGATASEEDGKLVVTYHMLGLSGVDPGKKAGYVFVKIPKPSRTLIIRESFVAGPAPAEVNEMARFEK